MYICSCSSAPYYERTNRHEVIIQFCDSLASNKAELKVSEYNFQGIEFHLHSADTFSNDELILIHNFIANQNLKKGNWNMISVYDSQGVLKFTHYYDKKSLTYKRGHFVSYD